LPIASNAKLINYNNKALIASLLLQTQQGNTWSLLSISTQNTVNGTRKTEIMAAKIV
jgi:hypothetical protein